MTVHFREKKDKKFFLQYFPYAEPTSIYHSKVYNYMQNNVKKEFYPVKHVDINVIESRGIRGCLVLPLTQCYVQLIGHVFNPKINHKNTF